MTQYPQNSRPVLAHQVFEEFNSITNRLMSKEFLRTKTPNISDMMQLITTVYFKQDWSVIAAQYRNEKITYNAEATSKWLEKRKGADEKFKASVNWILNEIRTKPISDVKVHVKVEQLLKEEPIMTWDKWQGRIIVY